MGMCPLLMVEATPIKFHQHGYPNMNRARLTPMSQLNLTGKSPWDLNSTQRTIWDTKLLSSSKWSSLKTYIEVTLNRPKMLYLEIYVYIQVCNNKWLMKKGVMNLKSIRKGISEDTGIETGKGKYCNLCNNLRIRNKTDTERKVGGIESNIFCHPRTLDEW